MLRLSFFSASTLKRSGRRAKATNFATEGLEDRLLLAATQNVAAIPSVPQVAVDESFAITASYSTTDPAMNPASGMTLRLHFDSTKVDFNEVTDLVGAGLQMSGNAVGIVVEDDPQENGGFDADPSTDKFVQVVWDTEPASFPAGIETADTVALYTAGFTAKSDFSGSTDFNFTSPLPGDGFNFQGTSATVALSINRDPVANPDEFDAPNSGIVTGNLISGASPTGLDEDPDGDTLMIETTPATQPTKGTVVLMENGDFTYTANANVEGEDTFTYTLLDGRGGTAVGTVTINFPTNGPPVANDDEFITRGTSPLTGNVIASNAPTGVDEDPEDDPLSVETTPVTPPTKGTLVLREDGSFTYTYTGSIGAGDTDSFVYRLSDGSGTDEATVTITIGSDNRAPVANPDVYTITVGTPLTDNVINGESPPGIDTDEDGDFLSISTTPATPPAQGTVVLTADGGFTYTANPGATGTDSFQYTLTDGTETAVGTVTITLLSSGQPQFDFDIDGDGEIDPTSDAILLYAWMTPGTPDAVFQGFIGANAPAGTTVESIKQNLDANEALLDIDGNGARNFDEDAILVYGVFTVGTPDQVLERSIGSGATRTDAAAIRSYVLGLQGDAGSTSTTTADESVPDSSVVESDPTVTDLQFLSPEDDDEAALFNFDDEEALAAVFAADPDDLESIFATDEGSLWRGLLEA